MTRLTLSGTEAWQSLMRSKATRWNSDIARLGAAPAIVEHHPKFQLSRDDRFFCMGSCFARNIEEHLLYNGREVLSRRVVCPAEEWPYRINGFVNKFTTASMLNEVEWVTDPPAVEASFFEETAQGWFDLQLCPGTRPVDLERACARRAYLIEDYFGRLRDASVVILTLGLNEVWRDARTQRYLNGAPSFYSARREPQRYEVEITDAAANVDALERIGAAIFRLQPDARIVVTVSPVPMGETFSGKDVAVANTLSKATLRVAAEAFARNHAAVDYFPSFDMIALAPRHLAYGEDCLHVTDAVVSRMMSEFMRLYLGQDEAPARFSELAYLAANPDVEAAARRGEIGSGFEHWLAFGQAEGRPLLPEGGISALMLAAAAV